MKVLQRFAAALLALALLAGVVWLGILSGRDARYVVWFGIASAIAAPIGLALFGSAFASGDRNLVQRLSKVPEIERLISEAKTQEDRIKLLQAERARLVEVVKIESRRQAIRDRIDSLENDAVRIIRELKNLDAEAALLEEEIADSEIAEEIKALHERVRARQEGDVVLRFGTRVYRIDRDIIKALPFGTGNLVLAYFRVLEPFLDRLRHRKT